MAHKFKLKKSLKTMALNERELKIIVLGLRFAMLHEIEYQGANSYKKDKQSIERYEESKKLIGKFKKTGKKIQNFLHGGFDDK